jgi:signal transduction histidine kinase
MSDPARRLGEDRVRLALACADLGSFEIDAATRLVVVDRRARELLCVTPEGEVRLDDYLAQVDPADRARVKEHLEAVLGSEGDPYHDEFRTTGRRWVAADGRTLADGGDRIVLVGVLSDVTLRRTTDDARARLVDEMARALRFNDMLVGAAAHDLRGPLAAVLSAADLISGDVAARIVASTNRMSRVVDQMLDVTHARLDGQIPLRPRRSDLAAIARQVAVEVMTASPGSAIEVAARADTECTCDPDRVAQVLSDLLGNAVLHGADPAAVRVVVDGTSARVVSIAVSNPGAIPAEITPVVFNPFRRVRGDRVERDRSHGLGLGLYIARRIVIGHEGDITVSSSESGTTFHVELPRDARPSAFSLTPDQGEEEALSLQRLGISDQPSRVTASLFGVMPLHERAPDAFGALVERHGRLLGLSLDRHIYRDARTSLSSELRVLAEQLGEMGAGANDVAEVHSKALQAALKGAPALKAQALVSEGRLLALEVMGRLLTYYRKRSGFGAPPPGGADRGE